MPGSRVVLVIDIRPARSVRGPTRESQRGSGCFRNALPASLLKLPIDNTV